MAKKWMAMLLAVVLCLSLLPAGALAEGEADTQVVLEEDILVPEAPDEDDTAGDGVVETASEAATESGENEAEGENFVSDNEISAENPSEYAVPGDNAAEEEAVPELTDDALFEDRAVDDWADEPWLDGASITYASYHGVDFLNAGLSADRVKALTKAMQMVQVQWTATDTFRTWCSSAGAYNSVTATDGTTSYYFIKGKSYTGIPYSMVDHTFDDVKWNTYVANGNATSSNMSGTYYSHGMTTTAHGVDCSYFVYLAIRSAVGSSSITYQTTATMLNSSYYKKLSSYSEMLPGDIFLKSGHVMMFVGMSGSKYAVFEADAGDSKCSYNTYTSSYLSSGGYSAYRFKGFSTTISVSPPATPVISSVKANSTSSLTVKWGAVSGAKTYNITRRTEGNDTAYYPVASGVTGTSYTDTGLKAGTKYWYHVFAVNDGGTSEHSTAVTGVTNCVAPVISSVTANSTSSLTVKWGSVSGAKTYNITRRTEGDDETYYPVASGITGTSYTDTGLKAGTKYWYHVFAVNDGGTSEHSTAVTGVTNCVAPVISSVTANSTSSLTVKWGSVSGAKTYNITRRTEGDDETYYPVASGITGTSYTDTGLKAGTKYWYHVFAVNDGGTSEHSTALTGTTMSENYLDVSGRLDGVDNGKLTGYGTVDVYINGTLVADDVTDYYTKWPVGTAYEIKDIKAANGKVYEGVYTGSIKGTVGSSTTLVRLIFSTVYTISYNANGGSGAPIAQTKTHNTALMLSSTRPTWTGYTFLGWATSSSATTAIYQPGDSYMSNAGATLYAVWQKDIPNTYTVTYNSNGGSGAPATQTKTQGQALTLSSQKPTRSGYTFQGWATSSTATSVQYLPGGSYSDDASVTLYAVWKILEYSVNYNANGGTGAPDFQTKNYGQTLILTDIIPTRPGYTFLGWATSTAATEPQYLPGGSYANNGSIMLYAVWQENAPTTYTVTYDANGGTGAPSSQTKTQGQALTLSAQKPTRSGCTFLGWATSSTATSALYQPGSSYTRDADITLYAVWQKNAASGSGSFLCQNGTITGTYSAPGSLIDIYVNGQGASSGLSSVSISYTPVREVNTVEVYVDGALANTYTVAGSTEPNTYTLDLSGVSISAAGVSGEGRIVRTSGSQADGRLYAYVVVNYERDNGTTWSVAGTYSADSEGIFDMPTIAGIADRVTRVVVVGLDAKVGASWAGHNITKPAVV